MKRRRRGKNQPKRDNFSRYVPLWTWYIPQYIEDTGKSMPQNDHDGLLAIMGWVLDHHKIDNIMLGHLTVMANEHWSIKTGRHVIFVPDRYLIELVYRAKFDIDLESITMPFDSIVQFSFPTGLKIDGVTLGGSLFTIMSVHEARKRMLSAVDEAVCEDEEETEIVMNFKNPEMLRLMIHMNRTALTTHGKKAECQENVVLDGNVIGKLLSSEQEFKKDAARNATAREDGRPVCIEASEYEKSIHLQYVLARICCGLLIYMKAFPDLLSNEFPQGMFVAGAKKKNTHYLPWPSHLPKPKKGAAAEHWRSWHFRELRADRYKKNTDGSNRIIFVKDTMVNSGQVNPHTLLGEKDVQRNIRVS